MPGRPRGGPGRRGSIRRGSHAALRESGLPPEILAVAHQGDFGDALTRWIVRAALEDSRTWRLNGFRDLDSLKISRSLVGVPGEAEDGQGMGTVEAIVGIGHRLGLGVTAEGVETSTQADRFRDIGCDTIQGYYVGRPLPPARVGEYLAKLGPMAC